jgi:hypothetical protein
MSTTGVHKSEKKEVCVESLQQRPERGRAAAVGVGGEYWQSRAKRAAASAAAPCPASVDRALFPLCG